MTVLWTGQGRGEENVADVELEGVEYSRGLGGLLLCLWSKRKNLVNCLREMASASELVLPGRCCVVMVKWCRAANTNRVCISFLI